MANYHLVILKQPYLQAILDGRKTVESRFTKNDHAYLHHVHAGDKFFLKLSSGPVCATAIVAAVKKYQNLTPHKIAELKNRYNSLIAASDEYWRSKADADFALLVWLKDIQKINPIRIQKTDWRPWVVLTETENFSLLNAKNCKILPKSQINHPFCNYFEKLLPK